MMLCRLALLLVIVFATWPALAQDAAEFVLRLNRLEGQVRQMSGHIEELQHENRQLREQLRKFQEDVEFRFQDGRGGFPRPSAQASPITPVPPVAAQTPEGVPPQARPPRRGDAFDPSRSPTAPGAPQQLGTTQPSAPLPPRAAGPLQLPGAVPPTDVGSTGDEDEPPPGAAPLDLNQLGRTAAAPSAPTTPQRPSVAATGTGDVRADYDAAYAYILQKQYEQAEMGFRQFLQSHPRDRFVPDALYWLGESYLQRNRHREAAEQFLKISTEHTRSAKAPDAMLKLGIALNALGARDQACATLAKVEREYPQASSNVRQGVEREQRRARCA